jgi:hypothetical protein
MSPAHNMYEYTVGRCLAMLLLLTIELLAAVQRTDAAL